MNKKATHMSPIFSGEFLFTVHLRTYWWSTSFDDLVSTQLAESVATRWLHWVPKEVRTVRTLQVLQCSSVFAQRRND